MINKQPKNDQEPGAFPEHIPDDYDAARLANLAKIEVRGQTSIFDAATRGHPGNIWKPLGSTQVCGIGRKQRKKELEEHHGALAAPNRHLLRTVVSNWHVEMHLRCKTTATNN